MPSARDPELIYRIFGRKLRELRERKRVPQQELATLSGLSRASIANIENGKQRVLLHQLVLFAEVLRVELAELVPAGPVSKLVETEVQHAKTAYLQKLRTLTGLGERAESERDHEKKP